MLACLATLLVQALPADSPPIRPIAQLVHAQWNTKDGAPAGVRALAQTIDGYLWLGATRGLVRFDGVRFVPFVAPDSALRNVAVRRLVASRDGGLWIVWINGTVSRLRDGRWTSWREADGLPVAIDLTESSTGTVVAGTLKGLSRFDGEKWTDTSREWQYPGSQSQAVWFDRDDGLWSETESRVMHMPRGSDRFTDPGLPLYRSAVLAQFAQEPDGTIWMTELYRSVHTLRRAGDRLPETEVDIGGWSILIDRRGSLWIGTLGDGLRRITHPTRVRGKVIAKFGAEAESFTVKDGLLADVIYALLEDRDGSIWVATDVGVERFSEGAFTSIVTPGGTRDRRVYATRDSAIWISAYGRGGIVRLDPSRGTMDEISEILPFSMYQDPSGKLYTTAGRMVFDYRPERRDFVFDGLRRNDANVLWDMVVDSAGVAWFVDQTEGLMRLAGDSLVQVLPLPPSVAPRGSLLYDRRGRIWIQRSDRLFVYARGELTAFEPSRGDIPPQLGAMFEDRAGTIWVTSASGLSRFEGTRFRTILPETRGIPEWAVNGIVEDSEGAWWLATRTGVLRLPPGEVERAMADTSYVLRYRLFDERDGVPGAAASISLAADGRIWVGTNRGVASIDPRSLSLSTVPPVLIESIRIDDREVPLSGAVRIPPNGRDFEIDFTSTALGMADRIQFRYRLDGEDPAWRDVGSRRRAYYTRLAPGAYTFRVTASSGDGNWNETPAVLRFRVLPTWYQTGLFRTSVVLLILGVGASTAWLVQRQRQQQMRRVLTSQHQATLAERSRLAGELHDTLLQAFTGVTLQLQALRHRIQTAPREAEEDLGRMLQVADVALRDARSAVWDMRVPGLEERDVAAALEAAAHEAVASHRLAGGVPVDLEVTIAGDRRRLSPSVETAAHRIGREALTNALRHAEAKCIRLAIVFEPRRLCVDVRDDGVGFAMSQVQPTEGRGHWGLVGMRERARNVRGTVDVSSAPGSGTAVLLRIPVEPT